MAGLLPVKRLVVLVALLSIDNLQAHLPILSISSRYLNFVAAPGGANPAVQSVTVGTNEHPLQWTATVSIARGGNWLTVSPASGSLAGEFAQVSVRVTAITSGLAAGVYYGAIRIDAPGAGDAPQVIEVALTVTTSGQAAPGIGVAPSLVEFTGVRTTGRTYTLAARLSNLGGGTLSWTATTATDTGGNWLAVTPASGQGGGLVSIAAAVGELAVGTYTGRVIFTAPAAANSPRAVAVSFRVRDPLPSNLQVSSTSVSLSVQAQSSTPTARTLSISNLGEGTLPWRASATTFSGGAWLAASPSSGSGPGSLIVSVDPATLTVGTYLGRVTVTAEGALNSPQQIAVNLAVVAPQPEVTSSGVVHAATFRPGFVAPGQILTIFGRRLGPPEGVSFTLDPETQRLPVRLAGTRVTFDGVPAPLFYVSDSQVNLQVPFELAIRSETVMAVDREGFSPAQTELQVQDAVPGIFTVDGTRAAALNQDFSLNTPENPAAPGSVVQLFLTGQGVTDIRIPSGALAPMEPPFPSPLQVVTLRMDAYEARVLFAGLAPGFAGLLQVNAEVPRLIAPSDRVRVVVSCGRFQAVQPATIAVR